MRKTDHILPPNKRRHPVVNSVSIAIALGLLLLAAACQKSTRGEKPQRHVFEGKGVVAQVLTGGNTIVIEHEAISNYMPAMTMPFEVADTNELRGLQPGDVVRFRLVVTPKEGWIEHLTRLHQKRRPPPTMGELRVSRAAGSVEVGDVLPNCRFTNELGQAIELDPFRGEPLAFTFFFTSCPFPNYCPRMTDNFAEVDAKLKASKACARWQLLSISFDTAKDTPARLLDYAKAHHYDPAHWRFLTGDRRTIEDFADLFDERFWTEGQSIGHNLRTVVVAPSGRVLQIIPGSSWSADDLAATMIKAARSGEEPR